MVSSGLLRRVALTRAVVRATWRNILEVGILQLSLLLAVKQKNESPTCNVPNVSSLIPTAYLPRSLRTA
jgi:hypothetical protein